MRHTILEAMKLEILHERPQTPGKTTPLLFVHGILHAAWCWENFLPYFARHGYPSYALSLRGHGGSEIEGSLRWQRAHHYVADVKQAVEEVGAQYSQPPVLIGHSMGGLIVQKYLEQYPAAGGVLLASVPVHGAYQVTLRVLRHAPLNFLRMNLMMDLSLIVETAAGTRWFAFSDAMPEEKVRQYHARMGKESYAVYFDMLALALPRPARVKVPMLVLCGAKDNFFSPAEAAKTARAYKGEHWVFAHSAHDLMLDVQWENVAERILLWLEQQGL